MRNFVKISIIIGIIAVTGTSCVKKTCAAYHSSFILAEHDQDKFFSYFGNDSVPKGYDQSGKNRYGIAEGIEDEKDYERRHYYIKMQNVYPSLDSFEFETTATQVKNDSSSVLRPGR